MKTTVKIKWGTSNKKYYINLGYKFTCFGDEFEVDIKDISTRSSAKLWLKCTKCGIEKNVRIKFLTSSIDNYTCRYCNATKRKYSIEEVKSLFIEENLTPLFDDYKNSYSPLPYFCSQHQDKIQYIRLSDLLNGHGCLLCGINARAAQIRLDIEVVRAKFKDRGYIPLFTEYKNSQIPLLYLCPKHGEQKISYASLSMGSGCKKCAIETITVKNKIPLEEVKREFENKNYTPCFDEYLNSKTPLLYLCNKHKQYGYQQISLNTMRKGSGCVYCSEGSINRYDKEYSSKAVRINKRLRITSSFWRAKIRNLYKNRCPFTEQTTNLQAHHLYDFNYIIDIAHKSIGLTRKTYVSEYRESELLALDQIMYYLHEKYFNSGVLIHRSVHKAFHTLYGKKSTYEKWVEFENLLLSNKLPKDILKTILFKDAKKGIK